MDSNAQEYVAFLLRLWKEKLDGAHCWRAALQNVQTREERYFVDLAALVDYLRAEFSGTGRGPTADPDGRREASHDI